MKPSTASILVVTLLLSGCAEKKTEETSARQEADANARAEAAKKEMKTLPQAFKPRYNRKLDQTDPKKEPVQPPAQKTNP